MSKMRRRASFVKQTPIPRTKIEPPNALIVQRVGCPKTAAPNAKRAVRGHSVMVAKIARWDLQEKEMTLMRRNVDNVTWGKQR